MRTLQRQRAQDETDEEAAGVAQKNGCGIEGEAQKTENRACQGNGHHRDQRRPIKKGHHKNHQSREQGGTGGQTIEAIDQIKCVGDGQNPQNRAGQSNKPGQIVVAEQHRDVDDPQAAHEQHGRGNALHRELEIRTSSVEVVVHPQQKDECRGHEDYQQGL